MLSAHAMQGELNRHFSKLFWDVSRQWMKVTLVVKKNDGIKFSLVTSEILKRFVWMKKNIVALKTL